MGQIQGFLGGLLGDTKAVIPMRRLRQLHNRCFLKQRKLLLLWAY